MAAQTSTSLLMVKVYQVSFEFKPTLVALFLITGDAD